MYNIKTIGVGIRSSAITSKSGVSTGMKMFQYCGKAEIFSESGELLSKADVAFDPKSGLLITVPRSFKHLAQPTFEIVFFDPIMGLVTCQCLLSAPLMVEGGRRSLRCRVLDQLFARQRRHDLKIPLESEVTVRSESAAEGTCQREHKAKLRNISAGGVYLISKLPAGVGDLLSFTFHDTQQPIKLTGRILRVEQGVHPKDPGYQGYGCRFVDIPLRDESLLRSYIFKKEREMHQ